MTSGLPPGLLLTLVLVIGGCVGPPDLDGDGIPDAEDCAPDDPSIHPGAPDPWGDGVDTNCDGSDGVDADGDLWPVNTDPEVQEPDCDDDDPEAWPGRPWEDPMDGVDGDCDGADTSDLGRAAFASIAGTSPSDLSSLDGGGDVDGDGLDDLLVGQGDYGRALVFLGSTLREGGTLEAGDADLIVSRGDLSPPYLGYMVAFVGDVDGDGLDDLAVTGVGPAAGEEWGRLSVVLAADLLAAGELSDDDTIGITCPPGHPDFGWSMAGGDVDGDGAADLLIGSPWEQSSPDEGSSAVYVFLASTLLSGQPLSTGDADHVLRSVKPTVRTAWDVTTADFDGDERADLVVGTLWDEDLLHGGLEILLSASLEAPPSSTTTPDWALMPAEAGDDNAGQSVAAIGDIDGDGADEVAVGVPQDDGLGPGQAWIIPGQPGATGGGEMSLSDLGFALSGQVDGDHFGRQLAGGGDVDGDGIPDLLVSSWGDMAGQVHVYSGADLRAGLDGGHPRPKAIFDQPHRNSYTGLTIHIIGDIDGDGLNDMAFLDRHYLQGTYFHAAIDIVLGYAGP